MPNDNGDGNGGISVPGWLWKLFVAAVALSLGIWWTSYVFEHIQRIPSTPELQVMRNHHAETIPQLLVETRANRERADVAVADIKAELEAIKQEQAKHKLKKGKRNE